MGVIKTAFGLSIIRALIALFLKTYIVEITFEKREMYRNTTNQIDNCLSKITGLNHKIAKLQQEIDFKEPTAEEKIKLEKEWNKKYLYKKRKRAFKLQQVLTSEQRNEHKEEIQLAKNEVENLTTVLKQLKKERDDFKTKINFEEIKELKVRLEELTGIFTKDDFFETAKKAAQMTPSNKSYNYLVQAIESKNFEAFTSEKIFDKNGKRTNRRAFLSKDENTEPECNLLGRLVA